MKNWRVEKKTYRHRQSGETRQTKTYYLILGRKRIPTGETNKERAEDWARRYLGQDRDDQQRAADGVRQRRSPLADHVVHYRQVLARTGMTEWKQTVIARIKKMIKLCGFATVADLDARKLGRRLDEGVAQRRFSQRTSGHYIGAMRAFGDFLVGQKIVDINPFKALNGEGKPLLKARLPKAAERRRRRRYLTSDELKRLLESAENGPTLQRISGVDRAMAYRIAANTGLRKSEMSVLSDCSFVLDGDNPVVYVAPDATKNRQGARQPLPKALVPRIRRWLDEKASVPSDRPLVDLRPKRAADLIRADLNRVGIPFETEQGVADFHSLRYTYCSLLVLAGQPLVVVQKLMRHSSPSLTANLYAALGLEDFSRAVQDLPDL